MEKERTPDWLETFKYNHLVSRKQMEGRHREERSLRDTRRIRCQKVHNLVGSGNITKYMKVNPQRFILLRAQEGDKQNTRNEWDNIQHVVGLFRYVQKT